MVGATAAFLAEAEAGVVRTRAAATSGEAKEEAQCAHAALLQVRTPPSRWPPFVTQRDVRDCWGIRGRKAFEAGRQRKGKHQQSMWQVRGPPMM